jgi:type II secretion system protein N
VKERLLKLAKYAAYVGYPLFYVGCLMVFAAISFPYDKLKERIVATYNSDQKDKPSPQELQIDELSGYWLSGVRMKGLRLLSSPTEPGKAPSKIAVDEATVRYSMLPALIGNSDVNLDVYAFGGELSGSFDVHGKDKEVDVTLDSIGLGEVEPLVELLGVPLQGRLSGTLRLKMPEGKLSKASGAVSLDAKDVSVGDGKAKIKGAPLALPKIEVGGLTFAADAKDGMLKVGKFAAGGKDLELQGDGRITLRETAGDSLCDAQARFKINDAYRKKGDTAVALFGAPGSSAPGLLDLDPKVKQSKRADGFYAWTLRGPLGKLEFIPAGTGGAAIPTLPGIGAPRFP